MTCSLLGKTLAVLTLNLSACSTLSDDQTEEVVQQTPPDFIGETNIWKRSEEREDTWYILLTDEAGNRMRIEILTYPGRDIAPIHVKYPCGYDQKIYHAWISSGAPRGTILKHCGPVELNQDALYQRQIKLLFDRAPEVPEPLMLYKMKAIGATNEEIEDWKQRQDK